MIQLDALKKRPERQTEPQKLTCRSSANFVSAGQKVGKYTGYRVSHNIVSAFVCLFPGIKTTNIQLNNLVKTSMLLVVEVVLLDHVIVEHQARGDVMRHPA